MTAPLALQLYTVREQLDRDLEGTLERVAKIGFVGVETAFFAPTVTPAHARRVITGLGLQICAIHCDIPIGAQREAVLNLAGELGCATIVWHGWPQDPRYSSLAGIRVLAHEYSQAAEVAAAHGLRFGIHNHWWEWELVEGHRPAEMLRDLMDPRVFFELDTYWASVAGCDAATLVSELGDRAPLLHIKDGPAVQGRPKLPVGSGVLDVPAIVAASSGSAEWLIVELDDYEGDMFDAVAQSYQFLVSHGLARGRHT